VGANYLYPLTFSLWLLIVSFDIFAEMLLYINMSEVIISKTTFLDFLHCPKNIWLKTHKPELLSRFILSEFEKHLLLQGNEVESTARNLFPGGIQVVATGDDACRETERILTEETTAIFQATFMADGFIAKNDVLAWNDTNKSWDLYEIKGTNSLRENTPDHDHIDDLTFQVSVLKRSGVPVGNFYIIHLNREYVRDGELDFKKLFKIEYETEEVFTRLAKVENQMEETKKYLRSDIEPVGNCDCIYHGRKKHCATFEYSNPEVPKYSVHDLSRISKKKLGTLIESGIKDLTDVPFEFELTRIQKNQLNVHKQQRPIINLKAIKAEMEALKFPLYFFDYEAFGSAIPAFDGYRPYQRIPFQFSLHILQTPESEPEHIEYLHDDLSDPSRNVSEMLQKYIKPGGTIMVWHKSFEEGVNREIGERLPEFSEFFEKMNRSIYDLEDIFTGQHYVHHGFRGSTSIKKVLPVIAPKLTYDDLFIHEGGQAADAWWKMLSPNTTSIQKKDISLDLKTYCGLDTYAMYAIWRFLYNLCK